MNRKYSATVWHTVSTTLMVAIIIIIIIIIIITKKKTLQVACSLRSGGLHALYEHSNCFL